MAKAYENLKAFRKKYKLSQQDLAKFLGVTPNSIGNYEKENEYNYLNGFHLVKLALEYEDIPLEFFLGLTGSMEKENIEINKQLGLNDLSINKLEKIIKSEDILQKTLSLFALNKIIENVDLAKVGRYLITPSIKNKSIKYDDDLKFFNSQNPNHYLEDYHIDENNENLQNFKTFKYLNNIFDDVKKSDTIINDYNEILKILNDKFDSEQNDKYT